MHYDISRVQYKQLILEEKEYGGILGKQFPLIIILFAFQVPLTLYQAFIFNGNQVLISSIHSTGTRTFLKTETYICENANYSLEQGVFSKSTHDK